MRDIFTSYIIPLVIPFISVYFAYILTKRNEFLTNQARKIKALEILQLEAKIFIYHYQEHKSPYSNQFISINTILYSDLFNVKDNKRLIDLCLEVERINKGTTIVINFVSNFQTAALNSYIDSTLKQTIKFRLANNPIVKFIKGENHIDSFQKAVNKFGENSMKEQSKLLYKQLNLLLEVLEIEIRKEKNTKYNIFLRNGVYKEVR